MASDGEDCQFTPSDTDRDSEDHLLLYGTLEGYIIEAKCLPNLDLASERMRTCFTMFGKCNTPFHNKSLMRSRKHPRNTSDPYVSLRIAGATLAQTRVIANSEYPLWDEHFCVPVAHSATSVEFLVKDNDVLGAQVIGVVEIAVSTLLQGDTINDWFPIVGPCGIPLKLDSELHISIQFRPAEGDHRYEHGVGSGPPYTGIPNTYFPLRKGGSVTLYQDAHVPTSMLPEITLDGGKHYQHGTCWEDICHAILEARNLIYIIGWSIYHHVKLVREPTRVLPSAGMISLGELLKYKSKEGVRVILLIWDDKTSHDKLLFKTEGVMQTHDEETKKFFKHSNVHCVLSPRYASSKLSIFKQQVVGTLFTHHQKCVLVDTHTSGSKRKITAFIGGLDLCDGRYDTPEHRLFRDIDTIFANDIHNPTFSSRCAGPRQPWHDWHCKVEGPAAYDIYTNFVQRWRKATAHDLRFKKVAHWNDDALLKLDHISWIISPTSCHNGDEAVRVSDEEDPENWHVQVFRSIDSGSVDGFPKGLQEAESQNLVSEKNVRVDKSIHTAYVKAIRSAQHFIYIENQYFLGSSYNWPSYKNAGADNLIPMELALKITSKISKNERFSVYVVIPMWPEGDPTSAAMQEILFWQGQTMGMMYRIIAQALETAGLSTQYHPQDYLNFYCLGKRERASPQSTYLANLKSEDRALALVTKYRRFMIYVHAKGMIVDDEYVLLGSANINQRSLDGSRDTEIAMGAYQPKHTWSAKQAHPRGQVYGYRMSLWAEHLGELEDTFQQPQTLECVRRVNEVAERNLKAYKDDDYGDMAGHLMHYPVHVSEDGDVTNMEDYESFPDVGGKVLGAPTNIPDTLTT